MANSIITITFPNDLPLEAKLGISIGSSGTPFGIPSNVDYIFNWVNVRSASNQVSQGTPTGMAGERSAINFITAFNLDVIGSYQVSRIGNVVTIVAVPVIFAGITVYTTFASPASYYDFWAGAFVTVPNDNSLLINIVNGGDDLFLINSTSFSNATIPCNNVKITVQTNVLTDKIISPISLVGNQNNPFQFEYLRAQKFDLVLESINGTRATRSITTPSFLSSGNFSLKTNNSPNGATVTVNNVLTDGLELLYSLDNQSWQPSNVFFGLVEGSYTLYVKDNYGCSFEKTFSIDDFGVFVPYFYISKSNSIRFKHLVTFGDSSNYRNDENTLSCEVYDELKYKETQLFHSADVITSQFKSNYKNIVVKIIKEDKSEVLVPIEKKTNNIGIKDKRDAIKYDLGNGKTGVYFLDGKVYDYDTGFFKDENKLNGSLPEWKSVGNYIVIANAWYLIEQVIYDEDKNAEVIVFSDNYSGLPIRVIAGSIYNRINYEVYEFTIDMANYIGKRFSVKIENIDPDNNSRIELSEEVWCEVNHEQVLEIKYSNKTNTDVMYSTGIEHKIRVPFLRIRGKTDEDSEVHKTDTNAILIKGDMYEIDEFIFQPQTKEMWRRTTHALSHENVFINGVRYVKNGNMNTESAIDSSNLYLLTASMIKAGNVYNSQTDGENEMSENDTEIVGLINTETGYLEY